MGVACGKGRNQTKEEEGKGRQTVWVSFLNLHVLVVICGHLNQFICFARFHRHRVLNSTCRDLLFKAKNRRIN